MFPPARRMRSACGTRRLHRKV